MIYRIWLLIIILVSTTSLHAQEEIQSVELFKIEDGELIWQCVYDLDGQTDSMAIKIERLLKGKIYTRNVSKNELGYDGEIHYYQVDSKRYGRSFFNTPKIYWEGKWFGKFFVELKDNKYRVTVYGLFYERKAASTSNSRQAETKRYNYSKHVMLDDGTMKRSERNNLLLMSLSLKDEFDYDSLWTPIRSKW